jgi:Xaa-Pro aminopeptidase
MNSSLSDLRQSIKRKGLDAIYISNPANVSYLSGFKGDDSCLLIGKNEPALFITDSRYIEQAKIQTMDFQILSFKRPLTEKISNISKRYNFKKIGFESAHLSFKDAGLLKAKIGARFIPTDGLVESLRIIKNKSEITLIEKAAQITKSAIDKTIGYIKAGMSELEIAGYLEWRMRKQGAERIAFHTIVASGRNACMSHAVSSNKKIKRQEPVIIDCGCVFCGYNSDLTRTVFLGRIDAQSKYIYNTIQSAQKKAISSIRPGIKISIIDKIARDYINKKGLGKYFSHATGHGIGCQVHEAPSISSKNRMVLAPGMVFTVEPAAYIPQWGGVRIEDMVLVTDNAHRILSE